MHIQVVGDLAQVSTSLLVKAIIEFATKHYNAEQSGQPKPHIGVGIGMCAGLLSLLVLSTLCVNHFFMRSMGTGVLARAALISSLFKSECER